MADVDVGQSPDHALQAVCAQGESNGWVGKADGARARLINEGARRIPTRSPSMVPDFSALGDQDRTILHRLRHYFGAMLRAKGAQHFFPVCDVIGDDDPRFEFPIGSYFSRQREKRSHRLDRTGGDAVDAARG